MNDRRTRSSETRLQGSLLKRGLLALVAGVSPLLILTIYLLRTAHGATFSDRSVVTQANGVVIQQPNAVLTYTFNYTIHMPIVVKNHPPTWLRDTGIPSNATVYVVSPCPDNLDKRYAGTQGQGVYSWNISGQQWERVLDPERTGPTGYGALYQHVFGIAFVPGTNCTRAYVSTWGQGVLRYQSGDWITLTVGLPPDGFYVRSLTISGTIPYIGTNSSGVYRWNESTSSWQSAGSGLPMATTVTGLNVYTATGRIYAATFGGGIYTLDAGSTTWMPLNPGLTDLQVYAVGTDPVSSTRRYAGTATALFRWNAMGWQPVSTTFTRTYALYIEPAGIVCAGHITGVACSENDGQTWVTKNEGFLSVVTVRSIAFISDTLFAGTTDGVWRRAWEP